MVFHRKMAIILQLEVMPLGQSKAQGMAFVLDRLGESADHMLAIGDGTYSGQYTCYKSIDFWYRCIVIFM